MIRYAEFEAARQVLALFDPTCLWLRFNYPHSMKVRWNKRVGGRTFRKFLRGLPVALVTHEFAHFVQATTTLAGIREFVVGLNLFDTAESILAHVATSSSGMLKAPVLANIQQYEDSQELYERLSPLLPLLRSAVLHRGGLHRPASVLQHRMGESPESWLYCEPSCDVLGVFDALSRFFRRYAVHQRC